MKIHPIKSDSSVIQNIEYKKEIKSSDIKYIK